MKKQLAFIVLSGLLSATAMAGNFTGAAVGIDAETTKYKVKDGAKGEQIGTANLKGEYGFDMGNELVGAIEAKAKLNKSDAFEFNDKSTIEQKDKYSVGYQQGYRVTKDLMPYAKVEYINSKFKGGDVSDRANGFGVGVGAKYAVADNVEVGAEYVHSRLKAKTNTESDKLRGNSVSAGVSYRFK